MTKLLDQIKHPKDLKKVPRELLPDLAKEMRDHIIDTVYQTGGHLGSALGVIELTIALHYIFNFDADHLVLDTGHQCYPHKLLTGRRMNFHTLRQKEGLYGFPHNKESEFDHFTTGHAGVAIASSLGLRVGDDLQKRDTRSVAVVGDAAIQSGVAFEAMNAAGALNKNLLVVLNDNEWSIAKSVGALAKYFSRVRTDPMFSQAKGELHKFLKSIPLVGGALDKKADEIADLARHAVVPGHVFEALGVSYYGPLDGHDLPELIETMERVKKLEGVVLLHLLTKKGKGGKGADNDPQRLHGISPPKKKNPTVLVPQKPKKENGKVMTLEEALPKPSKAWTKAFSQIMDEAAQKDKRVVAITAGMPDGTGLRGFGEKYPDRFFDVGICEQHGVAFGSGLAKTGIRPVVAIYSTFLQRAYDQVFQETLLSDHPVIFCLDRAGLVGEDGPTHHGLYDIAYLRTIPRIVLLAPSDETEFGMMMDWSVNQDQPVAIRYPRGNVPDPEISRARPEIELGKSEILRSGEDAVVFAYGAMVQNAYDAAEILAKKGIQITVVNSRFAKPVDTTLINEAVQTYRCLFTVEDHALAGGFGSAILEHTATRQHTCFIRCFGVPDRFIEHAPRGDQLKELGLDAQGLAQAWEENLAEAAIR